MSYGSINFNRNSFTQHIPFAADRNEKIADKLLYPMRQAFNGKSVDVIFKTTDPSSITSHKTSCLFKVVMGIVAVVAFPITLIGLIFAKCSATYNYNLQQLNDQLNLPIASPSPSLIHAVTYNTQTDVRKGDIQQDADFFRNQSLLHLIMNHPVVALQEVPLSGIRWLDQTFPNHDITCFAKNHPYTTRGGLAGTRKNDFVALALDKRRFAVQGKSAFLFSDNPKYATGNIFLVTQAVDLFSRKLITFVTTHLSGRPAIPGIENRPIGDAQAKEIIQLLKDVPNAVLMGDLNADVHDTRINDLAAAGFTEMAPRNAYTHLISGEGDNLLGDNIDHIMTKGSLKVMGSCVVTPLPRGIFNYSDHWPFAATIVP